MRVAEELTTALAGRYLVEREVGRGGMATVYLARDLRHDRPVALKVLHPELGAVLGPERFLSEIRVTANLQHPNLLPLFDSGEAGGRLFYTMPFVEGESLRQRLEREQQLPVEEAVRLAGAVAAALDHAHRKGVVHRDLKPENILLADGQPLVADFGIALAVSKAGGARVTQTGLSLGTPQYMSPEQAAGDRQLDGRTDVYALGCVLYEMLAGEPPFTGPSAQAVMAKLMTEPPRPVARLRRTVPAHVDAALQRALEKLPADRFATAHEFSDALQRPGHIGLAASGVSPPMSHSMGWGARRRDPLVLGLAATVVAALLVAGAAVWARPRTRVTLPGATPVRFTLAVPLAEQPVDVPGSPVVFSRDGRAILYSGRASGSQHRLYYRSLDQLRARPLDGTEGASTPFFSPDGASVGFRALNGQLMTLAVDGGAPRAVASVPQGTESTWAPNDVIIMGSARGLRRIPAAGGTPEPLTRVDSARGEQYHVGPRVLPDGRTVLFIVTRAGGLQNDRLAIVSLETGRSLVLDVSATNALGFVDGHLVIGRADGTIAALPFDLGRWRVTGAAVPLVDGVLVKLNGGVAASAADDGSLVYVRGSSLRKLELVDAQGVSQPGGPAEARRFSHPRFSPDGRRIAVEVEQSTPTQTAWADIWVHDLASGVLSRLTSKQTFAARPEWTPDGRRIAFIAQPTTDTTHGGVVWWVPADGSGPEEPFRVTPKLAVQEITFSPDGRYAILREDTDAPTSRDLWLVPLGDATTTGDTVTRRATRLFETRFTEIGPRVSPDGRWLAYAADESGQYEVYVRPFPGPGGRVQVSSGGGDQPVWAGDGRLVYRSGERFLAAALATPPGVPAASVVDRQVLFAGWYHTDLWRAEYDVRRDGQQLVVLKPAAEDQEVVVVLDWVREFRSRRPAGGPR